MRNIRDQYKTNKLKVINNAFELLDGSSSVSDIKGCITNIIKKLETLLPNPPIHI